MIELNIFINGQMHWMPADCNVAAALQRAGCTQTRRSETGHARAAFCGMGQCQECRVSIDGIAHRLACMHAVAEGMRIETEA